MLDIEIPARIAQLVGLPARETSEWLRQLLGIRHGRAPYQHGNDTNTAIQSSADFQPDKIVRIIESSLSRRVHRFKPVRSDDRQQHGACADGVADAFYEIEPRFDGFDVSEDLFVAEVLLKPVRQPARIAAGVFPPITDEDLRCRLLLGKRQPIEPRNSAPGTTIHGIESLKR